MKKVMIFMLALLVGTAITATAASNEKAELGKPAPQFTLKDLNGKEVSLADFKGKTIVLEWTNPGCPFVVRVYKDKLMTGVQKKSRENDVVWLTINSTNAQHRDHRKPEEYAATFKEWGAQYTAYLLDELGTVGRAYDAQTTPHMFIIDKEGVLVYNGAFDDDPRGNKDKRVNYVESALDELLASKKITTSSTKPYGCSVKY